MSTFFFITSKNPAEQGETKAGAIIGRQNATFSEKNFLKNISGPAASALAVIQDHSTKNLHHCMIYVLFLQDIDIKICYSERSINKSQHKSRH